MTNVEKDDVHIPNNGWIGVDLDGCLAVYGGWQGEEHIGEPIPLMVDRVKQWLAEGRDVRIFTARAANNPQSIPYINKWSEKHLGQVLPVTSTKDYGMIALWDDRCTQVFPNTGVTLEDELKTSVKNYVNALSVLQEFKNWCLHLQHDQIATGWSLPYEAQLEMNRLLTKI